MTATAVRTTPKVPPYTRRWPTRYRCSRLGHSDRLGRTYTRVCIYCLIFDVASYRGLVCAHAWINWHKLAYLLNDGVAVSCKRTLEPGKCTQHEGQLFCHQCHYKRFGPHALRTTTSSSSATFASDGGQRVRNGVLAYTDTLLVFVTSISL